MDKERDMIIGWKAIADFFGVTEGRLKMTFRRAGVKLPKLGSKGKTSPVYIVRDSILSNTLKLGFQASVRGGKSA